MTSSLRPSQARSPRPEDERRKRSAQRCRPAGLGHRAARRHEIKQSHLRTKALGGQGEDAVSRAVGALGLLADRIADIEQAITRATRP